MLVREFKLENERGKSFSLMDIENGCFLSEPSGLGYSYTTEYEQLGNTFITKLRKQTQGKIDGVLNFKNYDNYLKLINFIESSEALKFAYRIPFINGTKEYYKDVLIQSISKTQIQTNGMLSEAVSFDCLSLWYSKNDYIYKVEPLIDEIRWDFKWNSKFTDYSNRNLKYVNEGHVEAPILLEIPGYIKNPKLELFIEGQLYQTINFKTEINEYEKLIYNTKENEFSLIRQNTDGTFENLFNSDVLDFEVDNVLRFPKNKSCELRISADNEILNAVITVFAYYKAV